MQDGCKVYMDSLHGIEWNMFHNHLEYSQKPPSLEVGLTHKQETIALRTLITVGLFYFITCEDRHEYKFIEIAFG